MQLFTRVMLTCWGMTLALLATSPRPAQAADDPTSIPSDDVLKIVALLESGSVRFSGMGTFIGSGHTEGESAMTINLAPHAEGIRIVLSNSDGKTTSQGEITFTPDADPHGQLFLKAERHDGRGRLIYKAVVSPMLVAPQLTYRYRIAREDAMGLPVDFSFLEQRIVMGKKPTETKIDYHFKRHLMELGSGGLVTAPLVEEAFINRVGATPDGAIWSITRYDGQGRKIEESIISPHPDKTQGELANTVFTKTFKTESPRPVVCIPYMENFKLQ